MGDPQQLHLLHIGGDEAGREAVARTLQQAGYVVTEARTGAEALHLAATEHPDLLLLDGRLPDMTGLEVCRRLKADPATVLLPVIHLSVTSTDGEAIAEGLEGGADAYLVEPVAPAVLLGTVRALLRAHRAEQALRGNEARLRVLAEAMPHMVWSADQSGGIDYFNQRAYAYGGALAGGAREWHLAPIVHPEDKTRTYWAWRRAFRRGQAYEIEHRLRRCDGEYRWHLTRGLPVRGADGAILRWIGTATDIHQQKLAEEALRESEARYRRLFGTMQEGMAIVAVVTDAQGRPIDCRYLDVNPAMERYHGGPREQIVGHTYTELVPEPDPEWIAILGAVALTGRPSSGERYARVTGRWLRYHAYSPQAGQCAIVFEDITARRQAEAEQARLHAELAHHARLLDTIVENTPSWLAYLDRDLRYLRVNSAYAAMVAGRQEDIVGRTFPEVFPHSPDILALLEQVRDSGEARSLQEIPRTLSHRPELGPRYLNLVVTPVKDEREEVEGLVVSMVDVSAEVRGRERAVAAERARAELAEHLSDEIAHRVKNNLAMISGLLQMQVLSESDPEVEVALRDAVSRVRTFANLHEQMYAQHHETVDLLEAVQRIAESTRSVLSPRQEVEIRVQGERVVCAARDATNLCVITNELLTNALKHGGPGSQGRLHIEVGLACSEGQVCLSVWNSGPPIAGGFEPGAQQSMGLRLVWDLVVDQYGGSFALGPERDGTLATAVVAAEAIGGG